MVVVVSHHAVVQDDGERADVGAGGGLDVEACHAECGVTHYVDDRLVRLRHLRAERKAQAVAELR